jgi:hypothetical protein
MTNINQETINRANRNVQQILEYQLVACRECQHAVWPQKCIRHFAGAKHDLARENIIDIHHVVQS